MQNSLEKLNEIIKEFSLAIKWEERYIESGNMWHLVWSEQSARRAVELANKY